MTPGFQPAGKNLPRRRDEPVPQAGRRSFTASNISRLTADWIVSPLSADAALHGRLSAIRDRARDLERNNEWVRGYLRVLDNNVLGEKGISLQMRVRDDNGRFDEVANAIIERAWAQWGRVGNCTLNRRESWRDVQRTVLRRMAVDGEVLIRQVVTANGFRLQVIEADLLDIDFNISFEDGREVRFGVEFGRDREILAFHLLERHPGDTYHPRRGVTTQRLRIPADEIMHLFIAERPEQSRGFPWLVASMQGLRMLDGYSEAELVAARTGAAKMGFFVKKTPDGYQGAEDENGNLSMSAAPGSIEELPEGVEFQSWDTDHPNSGFGDFVKARLRGVATSLGVSYNTLSSDLEGVNYSSIRAGLLEEREVWKALQRWIIEHMCEPIFSKWLMVELLAARLGSLPFSKLWKFDAPQFTGRRWAWVDPMKDVQASILAINAGLASQRGVIAEGAGDVFDIFADQQADKELAASMGLTFPELQTPAPARPAAPPLDPED